jgi:hypothetical protein
MSRSARLAARLLQLAPSLLPESAHAGASIASLRLPPALQAHSRHPHSLPQARRPWAASPDPLPRAGQRGRSAGAPRRRRPPARCTAAQRPSPRSLPGSGRRPRCAAAPGQGQGPRAVQPARRAAGPALGTRWAQQGEPPADRQAPPAAQASRPAVEDVAVMSRSHMMRHTKAWLVDQCFQRQLPWDGTKEELAGRWAGLGGWVGGATLVVLSVVVGRLVGGVTGGGASSCGAGVAGNGRCRLEGHIGQARCPLSGPTRRRHGAAPGWVLPLLGSAPHQLPLPPACPPAGWSPGSRA